MLHQPSLISDSELYLFRCSVCKGEFMFPYCEKTVRCVHCQKRSAESVLYMEKALKEFEDKKATKKNTASVSSWVRLELSKAWEFANQESNQELRASKHVTPKGDLIRVMIFSEKRTGVPDMMEDWFVLRVTVFCKKESILGLIALEFSQNCHPFSDIAGKEEQAGWFIEDGRLEVTVSLFDDTHPYTRWVVSPTF